MYFVLLVPIFAFSQSYIESNEEIIFEFKTEENKRLIIAIDTSESYLIYRYGTSDKIEFEFPNDLTESWSLFKFSWYLRGGGIENEGMDLNYLYFDNENYKYVVFEEYSSHESKTVYGIKVINTLTEKEVLIRANSETIKGTLSVLRGSKKIKEGDELFK